VQPAVTRGQALHGAGQPVSKKGRDADTGSILELTRNFATGRNGQPIASLHSSNLMNSPLVFIRRVPGSPVPRTYHLHPTSPPGVGCFYDINLKP